LVQFPKDCQELATAQCIYADQLKALGVVDEIIWEEGQDDQRETYQSFPKLRSRIEAFLRTSLLNLLPLSQEQLVQQRYEKYRNLGKFQELDAEARTVAVATATTASAASKKRPAEGAAASAAPAAATGAAISLLCKHLAEEIVLGERSKYRKLAPPAMSTPLVAGPIAALTAAGTAEAAHRARPKPCTASSAKQVLDSMGAEYLCREWLPKQKRVLITDTTMRDAHQV
jgi:hypothetical protein